MADTGTCSGLSSCVLRGGLTAALVVLDARKMVQKRRKTTCFMLVMIEREVYALVEASPTLIPKRERKRKAIRKLSRKFFAKEIGCSLPKYINISTEIPNDVNHTPISMPLFEKT